MHWKDLRAAHDDHWLGLELTVGKRPTPPGWCVEFASPSFLRLTCAGAPVLWARIKRHFQGFWWLSAASASCPLEPLRAREVEAIREPPGSDDWFAAWGRHFAQGLAASPHSPLYTGSWHLLRNFSASPVLPQRTPAPSPWSIVWGLNGYAHQPLMDYLGWGGDYTNLLIGLKPPSELSPSRLQVWRKRAREGTLPPVLGLFITSLDCFVVLDGHHRWRAALEEQVPVSVLMLLNVEVQRFAPQVSQQAVVERLHRMQAAGQGEHRSIGAEKLNQLALEAWGAGEHSRPTTWAWPLPGRVPRWEAEVRARLDALGTAAHPDFREGLLQGRWARSFP